MSVLQTPVYASLASVLRPDGSWSMFGRWVPGQTPLSTVPTVLGTLVVYLVVIFAGQQFMQNRKPLKLRTPFIIHNALLTAASALLLVAMLTQVLPMTHRHGLFFALCNARAWTPALEACYVANYFFKYWELADTLFLVAKKKPLKFLHVFHHANTALLCFVQLGGRASVSWVPIVANLAVHVAMYFYYLMTAAGYKVWWKRYLTSLQIAQFVADLVVVNFAYVHMFGARHAPAALPFCRECAGGERAALFGCATGVAYLVLFVKFQRETYRPRMKDPPGEARAGSPEGFLQSERPAPISAASDADLARHLTGDL